MNVGVGGRGIRVREPQTKLHKISEYNKVNINKNDDCYLCQAYRLAIKDCATPPESLAEFLILFANCMNAGTVTSSMNYVMLEFSKNLNEIRNKIA